MDSPIQHFLSGKKIIVAGAGMAGLSFVVAIRKLWTSSATPPKIIICDRDSEKSSINREGYSMSLAGFDETGGLYALMQLGLIDNTLKHAIITDTDGPGGFKMWTTDWSELISVRFKPAPGLPTSGIRIRRKDLRQVLLDAVSETTHIKWGASCVSAMKLDNGRMRVQMTDHEDNHQYEEDCDLLIAADGASSKIRGCFRPQDTLQYAGVVQQGGLAKFEGPLPPPLDINWGVISTGTGVSGFFSPVDEHSIVWTVGKREPEPLPALDKTDPKQVEELLSETLQLGSSIGQPFRTLVEKTEADSTLRLNARDKEPFRHDDKLGPVIFIGDSNHAVSPFAGYGASLALKDGWDLAEQLCLSSSVKDAVNKYDDLSVPRALKTLKMSHDRIVMGHSTGIRFWIYRIFFGIVGMVKRLLGRSCG